MPESGTEPNIHLPGSAQASRIYFLPNLMTAGNLFCGYVAIIRCIQAWFVTRTGAAAAPEPFYHDTPEQLYSQAVWFIMAAVVFDSLDGRLARLGGRESLFGREFDSIADIVSFGVAPALMMFFLILSPDMNPHFRPIGWFIGFIYLLCAGVRLSRFNVITHPLVYTNQAKYNTKDFVGLPVPAAAGMIVSLVLLINANEDLKRWVLLLPGLMVLISFLMVSTIRYPSFKQIDWRTRARLGTFVVSLILIAFIFFYHVYALVVIFLGYLLFGVGRHVLMLQRRRRLIREKLAARNAAHGKQPANNKTNKSE